MNYQTADKEPNNPASPYFDYPTEIDNCRGYELSNCCDSIINELSLCIYCKEHCDNQCYNCEHKEYCNNYEEI